MAGTAPAEAVGTEAEAAGTAPAEAVGTEAEAAGTAPAEARRNTVEAPKHKHTAAQTLCHSRCFLLPFCEVSAKRYNIPPLTPWQAYI